MKKKLILAATLSAFVFAVTSAQAVTTAVTKPVGYHTIHLNSDATFPVYNLTGANFAKKILAAGEIDSVVGTTVTDAQADFTTAFTGVPNSPLTAFPNLSVEITSGANAGTNTEVTGFTGTTLTTMDDLSALGGNGDTYIVRELITVSDIFGPNNEAGLKDGSFATADKIWVPDGTSWVKVYRALADPPFVAAGWKNASGDDYALLPVYYTNGIIVERVPDNPGEGYLTSDLDVVITGHVRVESSFVPVETGFNAFDRLFPVGATLGNSGLDALQDGSFASADKIWMPDGFGGWLKYYQAEDDPPFVSGGWRIPSDSSTDQAGVPLTPGIIVERLGAPLNLLMTPDPAIYGDL